MKTCMSVAVLSTALIGGLAATSTQADAYAGWSCKPRVVATERSTYKAGALLYARMKWGQYVWAHYGGSHLARNESSWCDDGEPPPNTWFCIYSADPCRNDPPVPSATTHDAARHAERKSLFATSGRQGLFTTGPRNWGAGGTRTIAAAAAAAPSSREMNLFARWHDR